MVFSVYSLRENLILFKYILRQFGVDDIEILSAKLNGLKETRETDGKSHYFHTLKALPGVQNVGKLSGYDNNIQGYLKRINSKRTEKINLKFFQYLALLFTEMFLDYLTTDKNKFLENLNYFKKNQDSKKSYPSFSEDDLSKLAYYMATGSGKTLIMHINWLQYKKYHKTPPDNILLITPNEDLSKQHLNELEKSSIPAKIFDGANTQNKIQIIEIHKLTEEKRGEGVSVEISSFSGKNLVFVDEGHKGLSSGKAWKELRSTITGSAGFTFEYSATFDEAISSKKDELFMEYSRAIIIDYSYAHFYADGYGKEFSVNNLKTKEYVNKTKRQTVILFNLLTFYEQTKYYDEKNQILQEFSYEKPLWIFVGNTVQATRKKKKITTFEKKAVSDVLEIIAFFAEFLGDSTKFTKLLDKILVDETILDSKVNPIKFSDMEFLKKQYGKGDGKKLYDDILKIIFNSDSRGQLELTTTGIASDEIALRVSTNTKYFGLVYVSNVAGLKETLQKKMKCNVEPDHFAGSLFDKISDKNSQTNVLIGSKKFIEGWDSFRVSSMGLLNMGKQKGAQIMQLFGRGVRLKGYQNLMKRSGSLVSEGKLSGMVDVEQTILEKLNIFGIKADYVATFKEQLQKNGISTEYEKFKLPISTCKPFPKNLYTLKLKQNAKFTIPISLEYDQQQTSTIIDLTQTITGYSTITGNTSAQTQKVNNATQLYKNLGYFDWEKIFFELYNYKQENDFHNLYIEKNTLKGIMDNKNYTVDADVAIDDISTLEDICIHVLKKYVYTFYNTIRRKWHAENLEYTTLLSTDENFVDYHITVDKKLEKMTKKIMKLTACPTKLKVYEEDNTDLNSIVFDAHLFQPLIVDQDLLTIQPNGGLNQGEEDLVKKLREWIKTNKNTDPYKKWKFYLLRNLSKKGIGLFTETNNFYPDFILWILKDKLQTICFIDPKGLVNVPHKSEKIRVMDTLKQIHTRLKNPQVIALTSFIAAGMGSNFDSVKNNYEGINGQVMKTHEDFEKSHVVFQSESDYIEKIIRIIEKY